MGIGRICSMVSRGAHLRCPRCGAAPLFRGFFSMYAECISCGLRFEREQGYFVGAIYINYAVTAIVMVAGFFFLDRVVSLPLAYQLILWSVFGVTFPLLFFRHSRSLWLSLDYLFNPEEAPERYRKNGPA